MTTTRYSAQPPGALVPAPAMTTTSLTAIWETDPGLVESVLPRPLEVTDQPQVRARVSMVNVPGPRPFMLGASVHSVSARHGEVVGWYDLNMVMTSEAAVVGGRETFGEPKKLGEVRLDRDGSSITGSSTRMGTTFLQLTGTIGEAIDPPPPATRTSFYFKFLTDPAGGGFDSDPALVYCYREESFSMHAGIDGEVILTESPFDPVVDLPVRNLVSFTLLEHQTRQWGEIKQTVPSEWILPFAHQRYDSIARIPKPELAPA